MVIGPQLAVMGLHVVLADGQPHPEARVLRLGEDVEQALVHSIQPHSSPLARIASDHLPLKAVLTKKALP